jgi:hypothetical protein
MQYTNIRNQRHGTNLLWYTNELFKEIVLNLHVLVFVNFHNSLRNISQSFVKNNKYSRHLTCYALCGVIPAYRRLYHLWRNEMLKGTNIQSGNDEFIVKTYHASKFRSRFTNVRSDGHLYITNQRVIFRAVATDSLIHSEIPIDNVSGVNMYHGEYRDWLSLLLYFIITLALGIPLFLIIGTLNMFGDSGISLIFWGIGLLSLILAVASNNSISQSMFYSDASLRFSSLTQGVLSAVALMVFIITSFGTPIALIGALISLLLTIITIRAIPRRYSMSLAITSKGGSSTPIMLAGANSNGMVFSAAAQALEAEPGADANKLIEELGAIIHDIQTLGALGVDRWMENSTIAANTSVKTGELS